MHKYYQIYFKFIAAASIFALAAAYFSEYVLGLMPCKMCYYQRWSYMALIVLCCIGYLSDKFKDLIIKFIILGLIAGAGLAIVHVGVENSWFSLDLSCTGKMSSGQATTIEEYKALIEAKDDVPCDRVGFTFMGVTLAGWNFVYSLLLLVITVLLAYVFVGNAKYEKK